jgi:acylpyruvate hydrolase
MRLGRLKRSGTIFLAAATENGIFDLRDIATDTRSGLVECAMDSELGTKLSSLPPERRIEMHGVEYLAPVREPGKIICLGLNYALHADEGGFEAPDFPSVFLRSVTSLTAHEQSILMPKCSDKLDFEGELAVIIGRTAYRVTEADALAHVAGYSVFNDGTLRDYQRRTTQWTIGKNFDKTGGFGPWLVTPEEVPAGAAGLSITSRLSGRLMQNANTADMIFSVADTIALLSECMTLEPGDVIAMGTPQGVGYARTPPVFMKPGDECVVEIEGIGALRNTVAQHP